MMYGTTKYMGPANTKGARICVQYETDGLRIIMPYSHAASDAHVTAIRGALQKTGHVHEAVDRLWVLPIKGGFAWQAGGEPPVV